MRSNRLFCRERKTSHWLFGHCRIVRGDLWGIWPDYPMSSTCMHAPRLPRLNATFNSIHIVRFVAPRIQWTIGHATKKMPNFSGFCGYRERIDHPNDHACESSQVRKSLRNYHRTFQTQTINSKEMSECSQVRMLRSMNRPNFSAFGLESIRMIDLTPHAP
jgi:hypothetical protein